MDIRVFALLAFVGILGFSEAFIYNRNGRQTSDGHVMEFAARLKREVDDSNGETTSETTTQAPTTTTDLTTTPDSSTTPSSTTPSSTTPPSTTSPPTSPTTTPSTTPTTTPTTTTLTTTTTTTTTPTTTTTEATSPTTTPTTTTTTTEATSPTTTPTTTTTTTEATSPTTTPTSTSATTPTTTTSTTPMSTSTTTEPTKKPNVDTRFNPDDESKPEDSTKKPGSPDNNTPAPFPGPYYPGFPGPYIDPGFAPGYDPYFGYPGFNTISSPNYAWSGTNDGTGYSSAGAAAGSFAGPYPGMGYPAAGYPSAGSQPNVGTRGGFQNNSPGQTGYPNAIDPGFNPGFYFPGQYPPFNDPTFDMIKQIQAQIEAQHQAFINSLAFQNAFAAYQRRLFTPYIPNYAYSYANANNMGYYSTLGDLYGSDIDNSNMEFHNRLANEAASYGGEPQVASASINLGPRGGFQSGQISPALPGIESRFAEDIPPPSGNSFGVFSSSSSSSRTGPDGKQINHKSSITGINDNGKISFRKVED